MARLNTDTIRTEVREWLAHNTQGNRSKVEWMREVVAGGWACASWPEKWFGRGLPLEASWVIVEEFAQAAEVGAGQDLVNIPACTFYAFGSEDLKSRWLRKLVTGEVVNSLLYSEPGAGSDLASLQTRAELDGDHWIVNGQKVWTSGAQRADFGLLAARTNWDVPKHRGITLLWCPLKQEGVEIFPIRQATGEADFNEVFLTNVRVPREDVVGEVDKGWAALRGALAVERVMFSAAAVNVASALVSDRRVNSDGRGTFPGPIELIALAKEYSCSGDPMIRDVLAQFYALHRANSWNAMRAQVEKNQGATSPAASLGKLATSRLAHAAARLELMIADVESLIVGDDSPVGQQVFMHSLGAFRSSIAGGSDQIQRNVIGETILGLPREPDLDGDIPFRDIRKSPTFRRVE